MRPGAPLLPSADGPDASGGPARPQDDADAVFFQEYGRIGIHRELVQDEARTAAFRRAIFELCPGKVVLEIGCGTGILSMFAAQAGARHVVAVEGSAPTAACARGVVERNGCGNSVSVISGRAEDDAVIASVDDALSSAQGTGAPVADVLISEWMGYALVHEGMFQSVAFARDRWLKSGGAIVPSECTLLAAPFSSPALVADVAGFWEGKPFGVDLSSVAALALSQFAREPILEALARRDGDRLLAVPREVARFDCSSASADELLPSWSRPRMVDLSFELDAGRWRRTALLHGLALWFDCQLSPGVRLSTGPNAAPTHWVQTLLFLPFGDSWGMPVGRGDRMEAQLHWALERRCFGTRIAGAVHRRRNASEDRRFDATLRFQLPDGH